MYYEATLPELWQWLYLFVIVYATLPMIFAVVQDLYQRIPGKIPFWLTLPALLGGLILFTPYGWIAMWFLILFLFGHAPLLAAIVGTLFAVFSFNISLRGIFDFQGSFKRIH